MRVQEGRFTAAEAAEIRALGAEIGAMLDRGAQWWDPAGRAGTPTLTGRVPAPADGWAEAA